MSTIDPDERDVIARDTVVESGTGGGVTGATPATDLANLLLAGPIPVGRAAQIGTEIAQALSALHRSGAARGSVTTHDVLLDTSGAAYLAPVPHDAGVGAAAVYAAPERGDPTASAAAGDMYSLGVLLYEMVVGTTPFPNWDPAVVEAAQRTELPPLPSASAALVPRAYDDLVVQLLDTHAVARPNADEAASVLRRFGIRTASTPRSWYRMRTSEVVEARNPWPIVAAVLAGILVVALIGWLVLREDGDDKRAVPSVVGASSAEASARLRNAGFEVSILQAANNGVPVGFVVDQSPVGGEQLAPHATVVMTVSTGPAIAAPSPAPIIVQPPAVSSSNSTSTTSTSTTTTTTTTLAPQP